MFQEECRGVAGNFELESLRSEYSAGRGDRCLEIEVEGRSCGVGAISLTWRGRFGFCLLHYCAGIHTKAVLGIKTADNLEERDRSMITLTPFLKLVSKGSYEGGV